MSTNIEVPSVGESVTEAILLQWYKQPGDKVLEDEPICELETDKANVDLPAPASGILRILRPAGQAVRVGEILAVLDEEEASPTPPAAAVEPTPASTPVPPASPAAPEGSPLRPSVRRLQEERGLDLSQVPATGPSGVHTKEDVEDFAKSPEPKASESPPARVSRPPSGGERREPVSKIRKRIATRLVQAQQETAMLTTFNEVDLSRVIALRSEYKDLFQKAHGVKLGFMSFFVKAAGLALLEFPLVNAFLDGEELLFHDYVNIGVAVSTDRGLVVPVIKGIEHLSLAEIEAEIKRVAASAREGKLKLDEMSGGTFTITNGGVFGSMMSTPILNRPQSGILGMHAIKDRPVAIDGQVVVRPMMYLALSYDHRIIDGADSVRFLVRIKDYLEDPSRMLLQA